LYAKQFLEIKLFTFDYHEKKSQRTVDRYQCFIIPKVNFYTRATSFAQFSLPCLTEKYKSIHPFSKPLYPPQGRRDAGAYPSISRYAEELASPKSFT